MKIKNASKNQLSKELSRRFEIASSFSEDHRFLAAFDEAARNPDLQDTALKTPMEYLKSQGVRVPKGLEIKFLNKASRGRPAPDFEFFTIRLFKCRTYWVKKEDGSGYESVQVCFGFEIIPWRINPIG